MLRKLWFLAGAALSIVACSNGNSTTDGGTADAAATCDDAKCKMGNKCISDGTAITCRLTCSSNEPSDPGSCPFGFHCVDGLGKPNTNKAGESLNYCVKDEALPGKQPITQKMTGQWGTHCDASKGIDMNPDCDSAQGFQCYGESPTDTDAFCTQYGCTSDAQCRMGYWCATINSTPNVTSDVRQYGADQATSICLPRVWNNSLLTYSAPCKTTLDCPLNLGSKQYCVDPGDGVHAMCATTCKTNKNCTIDSQCVDSGLVDANQAAILVCAPISGSFGPLGDKEKGKGDMCSPCHSDADCTDGVCAIAEKSTERYCTKKSGVPCSGQTKDCPMAPQGAAPKGVFCTTSSTSGFAPKDHCFGAVSFAGTAVPGCWTAQRQ